MELEVQLNGRSLGFAIADPYRPDMVDITRRIGDFLGREGIAPQELGLSGLLPLMIRGVAGCEDGCPANAKDLVEQGYRSFSLKYVEGGILTAHANIEGGQDLTVKVFPEF